MNPLFSKQMNRQQAMPTMAELREKLMQVDDSYISKMEQEARKRGISEADIQQGKQYLNLIRNGRAY